MQATQIENVLGEIIMTISYLYNTAPSHPQFLMLTPFSTPYEFTSQKLKKLWLMDSVKHVYCGPSLLSTREALRGIQKCLSFGENVSLLRLDSKCCCRAHLQASLYPLVVKKRKPRGVDMIYLVGISGSITLDTAERGKEFYILWEGEMTPFPHWSFQTTWKCPQPGHLAIKNMSQVPEALRLHVQKPCSEWILSLIHLRILRAKSHHSGKQ